MYRFLIVLFLMLSAQVANAQTATTCQLDMSGAISQLFGMPTADVLGQAFGIGLMTPLTGYLVAYFVGVLVNFWNERG